MTISTCVRAPVEVTQLLRKKKEEEEEEKVNEMYQPKSNDTIKCFASTWNLH